MMISYSNTINKSMRYGYWRTPRDTMWVLIAAAEIERQESTTDTDIDVSVNLDTFELWKTEFKGANMRNQTSRYRIFEEPISKLKRDTPYPLSFNASGKGQLFYAATFLYALPAEIISARDEGLGVFRDIYDLDGNKVKDNELKLGETYRMKVVISSSKTRYNLGLRVPVPSGCDVLNSSFVTTGSYADEGGTDNREWTREGFYGDETTFSDEGYGYWFGGWWLYSVRPQQRIYKNEVTYRFGMFYRGQQTIDFLFRATTPGIYPTPPAFAEVLDEPEVFGRSGGVLVRIDKK
jgi:alpha-2-macroglobulin